MYIVIGTGAVAAEISMFFPFIHGYLEYDYNIDKYYKKYNLASPIFGDVDSYKIKDDLFILGMADVPFRNKMIQQIKSKGGRFATMIHPTAMINGNNTIGEGNIIYPQCIVSVNAIIGNYNVLTCQSILSHDCSLGDNNILTTTLLCGHVKVGNDNYFGIKSTAIPHVTIGSRNVIQAGMIIDKNVEDDTTIFYRHKEKIMITHGKL